MLSQCEAIDSTKKLSDVRAKPYNLPQPFEWSCLNLDTTKDRDELFCLLRDHYVEDDDEFFRFNYSVECITWALTPPGFKKDWHVGIRTGGKLVAFISAIPATMRVYNNTLLVAEVNYLCIHKRLRSKRLAPVSPSTTNHIEQIPLVMLGFDQGDNATGASDRQMASSLHRRNVFTPAGS